VLVAGGGVAGAAAAFGASARGHDVVWWRGGMGAGAFSSGAADLSPWFETIEHEPLSSELVEFATALGAWRLSERAAVVVGALGTVRRARLCDPLVLDLRAHAGAHIAVANDPEAAIDLAAAVAEQPWVRGSETCVTAVSCAAPAHAAATAPAPSELATDAFERASGDLTALAEQLRARRPTPSAWLVPEGWLPTESLRDQLSARLGVPVGTTLCSFGGPLGARLQQRLERLAPPRVQVLSEFVQRARELPDGVLVGSATGEERFDSCVLCIGGAAGAGVRLDGDRRLVASAELLGFEPALFARSTSAQGLDVASTAGVDFCALGVGAAVRIGFASTSTSTRLLVAGECSAHCARTLLGSAQSALDAVARLR
jgi:hypothetical protein